MDRQILQLIKADVLDALKGVGAKHNVEFDFNGGTIAASGAMLKLEIKEAATDGLPTGIEADFIRRGDVAFLGLPPSCLGQTIRLGGRDFRIWGYKPRATKMPVVIRGADGKTYKAETDAVVRCLKASAA